MVDFTSKNEGTWFDFDPDNSDLGGVCLREIPFTELQKIEKMTTKTKRKFKRGQPYDDVIKDEALERKLIFSYCIVDWKNVSMDGQPAECNMANKTKIMNSVDFVKLVLGFIEELNEQNKALDEARAKNSENGSTGS